MNYDITCVLDGSAQAGAIYISNLRSANSLSCRKQHNIRSIISVAIGGKITQEIGSQLSYLHLPAKDHPLYNLKQHFQETFLFIQKARSQGNILVHCMAGISRSAAIVAAYLIRKLSMSAQQAITVIKSKRNIVNPNVGFRQQLKVFQKQINILKKNPIAKQNLNSNISLQIKPLNYQNYDQESKLKTIPRCNLQVMKCRDQEKMSKSSMLLPSSTRLKSKTVVKIQRIKTNIINQMEKYSTIENSFQNLLASNIYKNKLKLR